MIAVNARFLTQSITGVQRYAFEMSKALRKFCNEDEIVFFAPRNIRLKNEAEELNVKIVGSHTGHLWEQLDLPRHLKKIGSPLLLNFCNTAPIFYKNKFSTMHDITYVRYPGTYSRLFRLYYRVMMPLVLRTSRHIFTVSEFSRKEISEYFHFPIENISVAYNAVSSEFKPVVDEKLNAEKYLLAVSSVKENKNFLMALRAFKSVSVNLPQVKLFIVGDLKAGNFSSVDLSEFMNDSNIRFLGRVSDSQLIKLYSNAVAFLFPSLYEGFGIPVLEAQACGCPVIASNTASLPEVLKNSAIMKNPHDVRELSDAITHIAENVEFRHQVVNLGYENIKRFSWEKSAMNIMNIAAGG